MVLPGPLGLDALTGIDLVLMDEALDEVMAELAVLRRSPVPVVVSLREPDGPLETFLEAGAADGVMAGVRAEELAVRLRAVLQRGHHSPQAEVLCSGDFVLDSGRNTFHRRSLLIHLPPKEFGLLALLMRRDGRVVGRKEALELVWNHRGASGPADATTVDVHVKRLRSKIEPDPSRPVHLLTVRGLGYRFEGSGRH